MNSWFISLVTIKSLILVHSNLSTYSVKGFYLLITKIIIYINKKKFSEFLFKKNTKKGN